MEERGDGIDVRRREVVFVVFQLAWASVFAVQGMLHPAVAALAVAGCVAAFALNYGDDSGPRAAAGAQSSSPTPAREPVLTP